MHNTIPKGGYPLYHHQDQTDPQPGRIWLPIGGRIVCGYDADPESVTMAVHHGTTRQYDITPYISRTNLDGVLDHLKPLLQRVAAGLTRKWDGSNHIGRMTEDAAEAEEDIRYWLDHYEPDMDGPWRECAICSAYGIRTYEPTEQMTPIDYDAFRDGAGQAAREFDLDPHTPVRDRITIYACQACAAELPEEA